MSKQLVGIVGLIALLFIGYGLWLIPIRWLSYLLLGIYIMQIAKAGFEVVEEHKEENND